MKLTTKIVLVSMASACVLFAPLSFAGGHNVRSSGQTSVNSNKNVNRNTNVNKNTNVNVNKNVNVNVDVDRHGGYNSGCCYHDNHHPVATIATVAVTAAVVGSIISASAMPTGCSTTIINGLAYQQCGSTWYQPQMTGTSTTYIVVNPPR